MRSVVVILLVLAAVACGCASTDDRVVVTPTAGAQRIPAKIAVYPLLTAETLQAVPRPKYHPMSTRATEDRMYIVPPAETKLVSTMQSQLMTGLLSAELSRNGFTLKELPVEAPSDLSDREENSFFVSLEALKHLRTEYGLEALLIGNVYFVADERDPTLILVRAAYLRLVDTATLDVLCHVSISDLYRGEALEDAARDLARALAKEAKLISASSK